MHRTSSKHPPHMTGYAFPKDHLHTPALACDRPWHRYLRLARFLLVQLEGEQGPVAVSAVTRSRLGSVSGSNSSKPLSSLLLATRLPFLPHIPRHASFPSLAWHASPDGGAQLIQSPQPGRLMRERWCCCRFMTQTAVVWPRRIGGGWRPRSPTSEDAHANPSRENASKVGADD